MTVALGGGHATVAKNLAEAIATIDSTIETKIIDVISDGWPSFSKTASDAYVSSTGGLGSFWFRVYYVITNAFPALLRWFGECFYHDYAVRKYREEQPDLIIATFPILADVAVQAREECGGKAPVVVIVTDAGNVQGIWASKRADMTLVATPDTINYLVRRGVPKDRIKYCGFPVGREFYSHTDRASLQKKYGFDRNVFTILFTAGGAGLNSRKALRVVRQIAGIKMPYQIILNAGHNDNLRQRFEALQFPYATKVVIEGFTDKMRDYALISDLVCSKCGWLTISEALALQRPMALYDAIPGHETQNARYIMHNGLGLYEPNPTKIARRIEHAIANADTLAAYKDTMRRAHSASSPYPEITRLLAAYLDMSPRNTV